MASSDERAASAAGELAPAAAGIGGGAGAAAPAAHLVHRSGARDAATGAVFALQQVARRSALPPAERADHFCVQLLGDTDEHGAELKYPYRVILCGSDKLLAGKLSDKERTKKLKAAVEAAGFEAGGPGSRQKLNFDGTSSDTTTDVNVVKAQAARWLSLPPDALVLEHHGLGFLGELERRVAWSDGHTAALRGALHLLHVTLGKQQAWLLECVQERRGATLGLSHDVCSDANGAILVSALEKAGVRCKRLPPWGTEDASAALRDSDFILHLREATAAAASGGGGGGGGGSGGALFAAGRSAVGGGLDRPVARRARSCLRAAARVLYARYALQLLRCAIAALIPRSPFLPFPLPCASPLVSPPSCL
jgi:hypothetical protein